MLERPHNASLDDFVLSSLRAPSPTPFDETIFDFQLVTRGGMRELKCIGELEVSVYAEHRFVYDSLSFINAYIERCSFCFN